MSNPDLEKQNLERWRLYWLEKKRLYVKLGKPIDFLEYRIKEHKAGITLGRDFGESVNDYLSKRGLLTYFNTPISDLVSE